jgi:hypothetical protein
VKCSVFSVRELRIPTLTVRLHILFLFFRSRGA